MDDLSHEEWEELMGEIPGGGNYGASKTSWKEVEDDPGNAFSSAYQPHKSLSMPKEIDGIHQGSIPYLLGPDDYQYFGMRAHRGLLHPEEYWDEQVVLDKLAELLGVRDINTVKRIYGPGGLSPQDLELRTELDAKFLELSRGGGNMKLLGSLLGFYVEHTQQGTRCRTMSRAINRARAKEIG